MCVCVCECVCVCVCVCMRRGSVATPDNVSTPGGLGQRNVSGGVELYRGTPVVFPHGVQCCTNTTITLCVGMYSDLTLAASVR